MIREHRICPVSYQPPVVGGYCFSVAGTADRKIHVVHENRSSPQLPLGIWRLASFYLACNVLLNSNTWLYVFSLCTKSALINGLYSV